jgi:hypothetical protein
MDEYFSPREWHIKHLSFNFKGISYKGNGTITWTPDKGFHIISELETGTIPNHREFRSIDLDEPAGILMELGDGTIAVTPKLRLNEFSLFLEKTLSIDIGRLLLVEQIPVAHPRSQEEWQGSAIYKTNSKSLFPDIVHQKITIGNSSSQEGYSRSGFDYRGKNGERILGELKDDKYLHFSWALPKANWTKNQSWHFAETMSYAISILTGEVMQLRYRESERGSRKMSEFNIHGDATSLNLIFRFFDEPIFDKDKAFTLACFLSSNKEISNICKRIFHQVEVAAKQEYEQATELLLATTLEAALRTIYHLPIGKTKDSDPFQLTNALKKFNSDYLSDSIDSNRKWKKAIKSVEQAYARLRHRNAHPDWITTKTGMLSKEETEQALNDMILLSRFYGYMILGMVGFNNLEPRFPDLISNWGPYATMENKTNTENPS